MYRRQVTSASTVVRLPPLPRRPKTNVSIIDDAPENPWGLDNPALRQLSTHGNSTRSMRNRNRSTRRSFRSSKITLPDINGRKQRSSGSARSMRSTYSTISSTTIKSTKSLDMFRYNVSGLKTPASMTSAPNLQVPTPHYNRKWKSPGSALSINSVSTIPLPPIEVNIHRTFSREDLTSTEPKPKGPVKKQITKLPAIPDQLEYEDTYTLADDDAVSVWPGATYDTPLTQGIQSSAFGNPRVKVDAPPSEDPGHYRSASQIAIEVKVEEPDRQRSATHTGIVRGDTNNNEIVVNEKESKDGQFKDEPRGIGGCVQNTEEHNNYQWADVQEPTGNDNFGLRYDLAEDSERSQGQSSAHRQTESLDQEMNGIKVNGEDVPGEQEGGNEDIDDGKPKTLTREEEERLFWSLPISKQISRIFGGDFRFLPPMTKTSVRAFFWASPNGFHEEREWIHAKCHTDLQEFCAERGLDFHLVDLHLVGYDHVPHEIMDDIFRDQLAVCQRLSRGPTVIALVNGDDMPRALPPHLSAEHFGCIVEIAYRKELPHRELLSAHFHPLTPTEGEEITQYELQTTSVIASKSGAETDRRELLGEWDISAVRLRELLRKTLVAAVVERKITKAQAKAYLEADPGDQVRQMVSSYPGQTLCYIRQHLEEQDADPQGISRAASSASLVSSSDNGSAMMRAMISGRLSVDISKKLNFLTYPVPSMGSHGRVYNLQPLRDEEAEPANLSQQRRTYLTRLCDDIVCDVKGVVNGWDKQVTQVEKRWASSPLHREVLHHARLCSSRAAAYCGPEAYLQMVRDYLLNDAYSMVPLVVSGGADKNKSKLMAKVSQLVHEWIQPECAVIVRFLGTSPDSTDIRRVLLSVIYQICIVYAMAMPKLEEVATFDAAISCFNALLVSVAMKHCPSRPLVLLFDCIEKATSAEGNHTAAWLPQLCPPNVYLITSIASDCQHLMDVLHTKLIEEASFLALDKSISNPRPPSAPPTDPDQSRLNGAMSSTSSSYSSSSDTAGSEGTLQADDEDENEDKEEVGLTELVSRRLDTLEERHGEVVITWMLSYLSIGEGISEVELLDALSCNEEVMEEVYIGSDVPVGERQRFPQKLWAMVQRDIRGFLEERCIDNKVVLGLSDEQVQETIESRYLNEGRLCECCTQLANILQGPEGSIYYDEDDEDDILSQRLVAPQPLNVTNHRKLRRLPLLLYRSQPFDCISNELKSRMLCNFTWLLTKLKALRFHNVIEDFNIVKETDDDIEFIRDLLTLGKMVIEEDPDKLCVEILSRVTVQDCSNRPFVHQLRVDAATWCSNLSHGIYIVPKFTCFPSPSGYLRRAIGGPWHIMGMCGDSLMIVWGRETGLEVWNATTSECLHHFCNPFTWEDTCLSRDNRFVYQTMDTNLVGWDVHTARKICEINILPSVSDTGRRQNPNTDDSFITPMAVSEDRMFAVVRVNKMEMMVDGKGLMLVDLNRELVVHCTMDAMGDRVSNCKFTKDSNRLIVTETQLGPGEVSEIHIFDCLTMELMGEQKLGAPYTIVPDTAFLTNDESKIVIGCRPDNFVVFSVSDCSVVYEPPEPADDNVSRFVDMKLLPTDQVVLLSVDITGTAVLRVSDLEGNVNGPVLTSQTGRPKFVEVVPLQLMAFVGFLDNGAVDIWDLERTCLVFTLRAHSGHMTSAITSPSCRNLYTGATDGTIKVWKFAEMLTSMGRTIVSARTPMPQYDMVNPNEKVPPIRDAISIIPTDVDDIVELDGGESLVDSDEENMAEVKKEYQAQLQQEPVATAMSTNVGTAVSTNGLTENDCEGELTDDDDYDSEETDGEYDEAASTYYETQGSRFSGSTRCTSRPMSKSTNRQSAASSSNPPQVCDRSGSHKATAARQSAGMRRHNTSAPGWARDGSFLNSTIKEDEMATNSPGIDIQQLVSGQRFSGRGPPTREGNLSNRSCSSVRSQHQLSGRSSHQGDRESTANTDRTNDTNARLEEIFRKLDQQVLNETPRFDSFQEPILTTIVLGRCGELLDNQTTETKEVNTFQVTEDGIYLVTTHRKGPPILWNINRAEIVHRMEVPWDTGTTTELLLAPGGKRIFGLSRLGYEIAQKSGFENCVRVWDLETGACDPMPEEPLYADAFALTPDKKRLLLFRKRDNGHTRFLVLDASNMDRLLLGEVGSTLCSPYVHVTSNVRFVITCDPGRQVTIWDILREDEYGVSLHMDLPLATIPPAMKLIDSEKLLIVGTGFGNVLGIPLEDVFDMKHEPDRKLHILQDRHQGEVLCLELSRDQTLLVSSGSDHVIKVIEREKGHTRHNLHGHKDLITCMHIAADNRWLMSGSHDRTVRMWNMESGEMVSSFHTYHDVFNIHISLDSNSIACLVDQHGSRRLIIMDIVRAKQRETTIAFSS